MSIRILRASAEFVASDELLALLREAFAFQHSRIDPPSSLHRLDAASIAAKAREEQLFLAMEGGTIVGCVFAKPKGGAMYIGKFAVSPQRQGQGIGRSLLDAVESVAKRNGLTRIELETRIELIENHAAFGAMGFVKTAEHAHPGYTRPTFIAMAKDLGQPRGET